MKNEKEFPLISVITVVYNNVEHIEETIKSVINQSYKNVAYIIIDGGSTDGTVDIIKKYKKKIYYWVSEPDKGIYDAMNKGISHAKGDYINFLNSGDTFYSNKVISKIAEIINKKDADLIYGKFNASYSTYNIIKDNQIYLKFGKGICHQTAFVKNRLLKENNFDKNYKSAADFNFFCKIMDNKKSVRKTKEIIINYRSGGFSSNKDVTYSEYYTIIKKYFGKYYAYRFYFLKIFLEQGTKKILQKLGFKKILSKLIEINNKRETK